MLLTEVQTISGANGSRSHRLTIIPLIARSVTVLLGDRRRGGWSFAKGEGVGEWLGSRVAGWVKLVEWVRSVGGRSHSSEALPCSWDDRRLASAIATNTPSFSAQVDAGLKLSRPWHSGERVLSKTAGGESACGKSYTTSESWVVRSKGIPTSEQKTQCFVLCCWFTKLYLPINLVRVDERTGNVFFLAGEENILEISPNGRWRYVQ